MIFFADDIALISTNTAAANRLLAEVRGVSKQFGLRLNRNKCCYISMNGNNVVKFPDGQKLNRVEETTYHGHQVTQEMDVKHEIQHKMHQTLKTWFKLDTFWKTTVCSTRCKLHVYDVIIRNTSLWTRDRTRIHFNCRAYTNSWVSAKLLSTVQIRTILYIAKGCKSMNK